MREDTFSLERWHRRNHYYGWGAAVPMEHCWFCAHGLAVCKSKVTYADPKTAHLTAVHLNVSGEMERTLTHYQCHYCRLWHLTSKLNKRQRKSMEKARRKALWKGAA
jgi:hypothetical protein